METLTTTEGQKVVQDLKLALDKVKSEIKSKGAVNVGVEFLEKKKDTLQEKLNDLLKKGGVITEEDYNDSYTLIRAKEEKELTDLYKKGNRRVLMVIGIAVLLSIGIYVITKRK